MTIDEHIKILESNAEFERKDGDLQGCLNFRQLAEWLKELKAHREAWVKMITEIKEYQKDAFYYDDVTIRRKQVLEVINKYKPKEDDAE